MIVDDLFGVIVSYATTQVTFGVLTSFFPNEMYNKNIWRKKAIVESRGLMVDDSVVAGHWYEYYLKRNRTYWGSLLSLAVDKVDNLGHTTYDHNETDYTVIFARHFGGQHKQRGSLYEGLVQHANMTMYLQLGMLNGITHISTIDRRVRQVHHGAHFILVDEYGDVWAFSHITKVFVKITVGLGVVTVGEYNSAITSYVAIDRDGNMFNIVIYPDYRVVIRRDDSPECPKLVELRDFSTYLTSSGFLVRQDPLKGIIPARSQYLDTLLTANINNHLKSIRDGTLRIVSSVDNVVMMSDRTIYSGIARNGPRPINRTKNRSQNIYQVDTTVFTIIDPDTPDAHY